MVTVVVAAAIMQITTIRITTTTVIIIILQAHLPDDGMRHWSVSLPLVTKLAREKL